MLAAGKLLFVLMLTQSINRLRASAVTLLITTMLFYENILCNFIIFNVRGFLLASIVIHIDCLSKKVIINAFDVVSILWHFII